MWFLFHTPLALILSLLFLPSLFLSPCLGFVASLSLSLTFHSLLPPPFSLSSAVAISDVKVLSELEGSAGNAKYITVRRNKESNGDTHTGGFSAFTELTRNHARGCSII